jgi:hypothetical protein
VHGRDANAYLTGRTVAERFHYDYSDAELDEVKDRADALARVADEVHVVFNNNSRDFAPRAAERLRRKLGQSRNKRRLTQHGNERFKQRRRARRTVPTCENFQARVKSTGCHGTRMVDRQLRGIFAASALFVTPTLIRADKGEPEVRCDLPLTAGCSQHPGASLPWPTGWRYER